MLIVQVVMVVAERAGFLYIAYNLSWVVHVFHSIDFILLFYLDKKDFVQIFQGYRKFYRYGTDEHPYNENEMEMPNVISAHQVPAGGQV